jgi:hypothetical protein
MVLRHVVYCKTDKTSLIQRPTGHAFAVCILHSRSAENQNQVSFYFFVLHGISVLIELTSGRLCCRLEDVPPQPNSPPDDVFRAR